MSHSHDHDHDHQHQHGAQDVRHYRHAAVWQQAGRTQFAFIAGGALNLALVVGEYLTGWWTGSLSLIADASHNLTDVLGLLLAYIAVRLAARLPTRRYTYGFGSATILAALANGVLLIFISGALAWQSIDRLQAPLPVAETPVIVVALLGALINGVTATFFHGHAHDHGSHGGQGGQGRDVNMRGVYLHMLGDMGISIAVAVGALATMLTGALWVDPVLSLLIVVAILASSWGLLREAVDLAMQGVPRGIDMAAVRDYLETHPGVEVAHDLHIWGLSTTEVALTAHLVMPAGHPGDDFLEGVTNALAERFGIVHATLQIETTSHHMHCPAV